MRKVSLILILLIFYCACSQKENNVEFIQERDYQVKLYKDLLNLTSLGVDGEFLIDSSAFLLFPIQDICPSCRNKIIDCIVANQNTLDKRHIIIISARGGKKTIEAFFRERKQKWPDLTNAKLFLDSTAQASRYELFKDKPVFYYGYKERIIKKISSVPATIKEDLRLFFNSQQ